MYPMLDTHFMNLGQNRSQIMVFGDETVAKYYYKYFLINSAGAQPHV